MRKIIRRRKGLKRRAYDPLAAMTWEQVAQRYNARNGTHLTPARMMQIGRNAIKKLSECTEELIGSFENYYGNQSRNSQPRLYSRDVRLAEGGECAPDGDEHSF